MNKKKFLLIKKIKATQWFKSQGYENNFNNYSLEGLEEDLNYAKRYDSNLTHLCLSCKKMLVTKGMDYCLRCYKIIKSEKRKKKLSGNLDECLSIGRPEYKKYARLCEYDGREESPFASKKRRKEVWALYFAKDFPNYRKYVGFLRSMRLDPLDKIAIEIKVAELDGVLQKVMK